MRSILALIAVLIALSSCVTTKDTKKIADESLARDIQLYQMIRELGEVYNNHLDQLHKGQSVAR